MVDQILSLITTYPIVTACIIALCVLLVMALVFPARLYLFRIKFRYIDHYTLMQFHRRPNILARILFYSTPTIVRYIGHGSKWKVFQTHEIVKSKRLVAFLHKQESKEALEYQIRIRKKVRA